MPINYSLNAHQQLTHMFAVYELLNEDDEVALVCRKNTSIIILLK